MSPEELSTLQVDKERRITRAESGYKEVGWRTLKGFHCWGKSEYGSHQETELDKQIDTRDMEKTKAYELRAVKHRYEIAKQITQLSKAFRKISLWYNQEPRRGN